MTSRLGHAGEKRLWRFRAQNLCSTTSMSCAHWDNLKAWAGCRCIPLGRPAIPALTRSLPSILAKCAIVFGSFGQPRPGGGRAFRMAEFNVGYGMQPYYDDIEGAPQNSIIGGATPVGADRQGRRRNTKAWHVSSNTCRSPKFRQSGISRPATCRSRRAAYDLGAEQNFYAENPGAEISIQQMTLNTPTANSKGLRFGSFVQIRDIISEEMEAVMSGAKTGQQAADDAVRRGNELLRQFEAQN